MTSTFTRDAQADVLEAIGSNLPAAAEAFCKCFGFETCQFELGEAKPLHDSEPDGFDGPGLLLAINVVPGRLIALIPANLLPDGFDASSEDSSARLDALGSGWAEALLPAEFERGTSSVTPVDHLWSEVHGKEQPEWATRVDLSATIEDSEDPYAIRLVWPLGFSEDGVESDLDENEEEGVLLEPPTPKSHEPEPSVAPSEAVSKPGPDRLSRLAGITVPLSVRLASKRIDIQQLIELTPGALVPFDKNCESPLELFVANQRLGMGEAVKVGENFGLKIDVIGGEPE